MARPARHLHIAAVLAALVGAVACSDSASDESNVVKPSLSLTPAAVDFDATPGGALPAARDVAVATDGDPVAGLSLTVTYADGDAAGWLDASLGGASTPATLSVRPSRTDLAAGTHVATVRIASDGAGNSPQEVAVTLHLTPGAQLLTVTTTGSGADGSVSSSPAGIGCTLVAGVMGGDCTEALPAGTSVTLTATAGGGSAFTGWSGACTGTAACQLTMSEARSVTAAFQGPAAPGSLRLLQGPSDAADSVPFSPQPRVQVLDGQGQPYAVAGVLVQALLMSGDGARIGTNTVATDASGVATWTDLGLNASAAPASFVLRFALRDTPGVYVDTAPFTVAVAAFVVAGAEGFIGVEDLDPGTGHVLIGSSSCGTLASCTVGVPAGTTVTVTAVADSATSFFVYWKTMAPCPTGTTAVCTFTATGTTQLSAYFALRGYTTSVVITGTGDGSVSAMNIIGQPPPTCNYAAGVMSGTCVSTQSYGARATRLQAFPAPGSTFAGWGGDCSGTDLVCLVPPIVNGTRQVTATFSR